MTTNDPKFVSVGDYRLTIGSSAIGTGTNQTWMVGAKDLDGNDRIVNTTVDMGCYEYIALSTPAIMAARVIPQYDNIFAAKNAFGRY